MTKKEISPIKIEKIYDGKLNLYMFLLI